MFELQKRIFTQITLSLLNLLQESVKIDLKTHTMVFEFEFWGFFLMLPGLGKNTQWLV